MVRLATRVGSRYGKSWVDYSWECECGRPKQPKWTDLQTAMDRGREHEDWHQRKMAPLSIERHVRRLDNERTESLGWRG